jgi:hypothetical protein
MLKGEARFSYIETGKQTYWKVTRHICVLCAEKTLGRDKVPREYLKEFEFSAWEEPNGVNIGTVKRWLRPITDEMKGE